MTLATTPMPSPAQEARHLVLLGAGHAHVQVLAALAAQPFAGTTVTLVEPCPHHIHAGMVPGFVAGHYTLDECVIPLEPLVQRGCMRWIAQSVSALDAPNQTVRLDDGSSLRFDWLSVNTGLTQDRAHLEREIPGAREHALFLRPREAFTALWPRVAEMGDARALRVTVIGGGTDGVELALAVRHRLPNAAVTLLCGDTPPGVNGGAGMDQRLHQHLQAVLKRRKVTVLQDVAVALTGSAVQLGCGADLACDVPLLATGTQTPTWLADSGLALDHQGFIVVDSYQRSTSHAQVFAAGDVCTYVDRPLARSGLHALRAGSALAHNLAAATAGGALRAYQPPAQTVHLLSCGDRYAVGSWGSFGAQGRALWWLKDWLDRRFTARHRLPS